jgi:hypothetical protein
MDNTRTSWRQFEDLVRRILEAKDFVVEVHSPRGEEGFDFIGLRGNERWAIEVKYYRTARAQPSLIEAAANRVIRGSRSKDNFISKGMLVVSCILPPTLRSVLEDRYSIVLVDRVVLRDWAALLPDVAQTLDALLEPDSAFLAEPSPVRDDLLAKSKPIRVVALPAVDTRGTELCRELRAVRRGREGWAAYEQVCEKILRYLFRDDLVGWHSQKRTDDALNRFDFVCRVRPNTEFWRFLIDHLNSRYVLFEFKNYVGKIKQGQILTTEKYMLERGLRRVAIILTRKGADRSALSMVQGAMREHGKLMLVLNDDNLCDMLDMKQRGLDPTDSLFEVADGFLLSLPR